MNIKYIAGCTDLYRRYRGQSEPQPVYVSLDCRDGKLSADYSAEIGNGCSEAEYYGHIQCWRVPCLVADEANELLDAIADLAEIVVAGYAAVWDGSRRVARFDEEAEGAIAEIEELVSRRTRDARTVCAWDASEWFRAAWRDDVRVAEELGITASATDDDLDAIEGREAEFALREAEGVVVLDGLRRYLERLRDAARAAAAADE